MITIRKSLFGDKKYFYSTNSVAINGWLLQKPLKKRLKNGAWVIKFTLFQLTEKGYEIYPCQSFDYKVIDILEHRLFVCLVNAVGRLTYSMKKQLQLHIVEIEVSHEFTNTDLDEMYGKDWGKEND